MPTVTEQPDTGKKTKEKCQQGQCKRYAVKIGGKRIAEKRSFQIFPSLFAPCAQLRKRCIGPLLMLQTESTLLLTCTFIVFEYCIQVKICFQVHTLLSLFIIRAKQKRAILPSLYLRLLLFRTSIDQTAEFFTVGIIVILRYPCHTLFKCCSRYS